MPDYRMAATPYPAYREAGVGLVGPISVVAIGQYKGKKQCKTVCLTGIIYATEVMVVGKDYSELKLLTLRVVACGNAFSLRSNRTLVEASHPSRYGEI